MIRCYYFVVAVLLWGATPRGGLAQSDAILPQGLTAEEAELMPYFVLPRETPKNFLPPAPPGPVRTMAEWEEIQALVITWAGFPTILTEITRYAAEECRVIVITDNPAGVSATLTQAGVPLDSVELLNIPFNSVWVRDYGPWTIYFNEVDSLAIADYVYNRPNRPADNLVPSRLAQHLNLPYYGATEGADRWVHSGGNLLRDGMGTAWSSDLLLQENPGKNEPDTRDLARRYFGIERYHLLRRLPFDGIHHLDMHLRTIDEETMMVGQYPPGVADGPQIEANLDYLLNSLRTPYGNPYRIVRMPMPPDALDRYPDHPNGHYRTYTNSIFVNKTLLVPIYEEQYDTVALRIYRETLPGYRVVGIDCNEIIPASGALHCITKLIGVPDPLWISHARLADTYAAGQDHPVAVRARHRTGIAEVWLHYRTLPDTAYTRVPLMPGFVDDGTYYGAIPTQPAGAEVQYYVEAVAVNGKTQVRPLPAPAGYFHFKVLPYTQAPEAHWLQTAALATPGGAITFDEVGQHGVAARTWLFPGGEPSVSASHRVAVTYAEPGVYPVQLVVENPWGADTLLRPDAVRIVTPTLPFSDDFSAGLDPAWEVINEDNDATAWTWIDGLNCGGAALRVNNHAPNNAFTREYLRRAVDLRGYTSASLSFDVAYARRNNTTFSRWDELRVNVINPDGVRLNLYNKGGTLLATRPGSTSLPFSPASCAEWRTDHIDLSSWIGQVVVLEFESIGDNGNNLYLDNIALQANARPEVSFSSPSPDFCFTGLVDSMAISLETDVFDANGQDDVARVTFALDGQPLATDSLAPFAASLMVYEPGLYCATAQAFDQEGAASEPAEVCFEVKLLQTATAQPPGFPFSWQLAPNPFDAQVSLLTQSEVQWAGAELQLYDKQGRELWRRQLTVPPGQAAYLLDIPGLPAGAYWVQLRLGNGQQQRQTLIKAR